MTHELKHIIQHYEKRRERAVLASVVALDGSSYRRPGVRMMVYENGDMVGAVSGGCVEREVFYQAGSVFETRIPKIMVYDGRYRLGCEGVLYILLEIFEPTEPFLDRFWDSIGARRPFAITSYFKKEYGENADCHTRFTFGKESFPVSNRVQRGTDGLLTFEQEMPPCFQLLILGGEHDAVLLCRFASQMGWEVTVVVDPREEKTEKDFPGIHRLLQSEPGSFEHPLDRQTAVMVMTHSFAKDLRFVMALREERGAYFGLLGPTRRREKLFVELMEHCPDVSADFLEGIHAPAGIDIGAETPEEIAISILSEILSTIHGKEPRSLKHIGGKIHQ